MKKTALALVAALVLLTGCGNKAEAEPQANWQDLVRASYPASFENMDDLDMSYIARNACNVLDSGQTVYSLSELTVATVGWQESEAYMYLIGQGVSRYCPEYVEVMALVS